jgi:hypothetical protein
MSDPVVPVSLRAIVQRLNRHLKPTEATLKKARGRYALAQFGAYYILNWRCNTVEQSHVDPAALAREAGVLKPWEYVPAEGD